MSFSLSDAISSANPRVIDDSRARKLSNDLKRCTYYETCATYGLNVERVFQDGKNHLTSLWSGQQSPVLWEGDFPPRRPGRSHSDALNHASIKNEMDPLSYLAQTEQQLSFIIARGGREGGGGPTKRDDSPMGLIKESDIRGGGGGGRRRGEEESVQSRPD